MSITVNADVTLDDFPYKKYFSVSGYYYAIISKKELIQIRQSGNFPPDNYFDYDTGMSTEATNNQDWWCVQREYQGEYSFEEAYLCTWYPTGWQLRNGWGSGQYLCLFPVVDESTTLPSDFPTLEFESLEEALSKTTSTTNSALTIQSNVGTSYQQYQAGEIDLATLETNLQSALDQLETLANASGNTLSDQIAVNNAITYTQTIQQITNTENIMDQQEVNPDLFDELNDILEEVQSYYSEFINNNFSQDETIHYMRLETRNCFYLLDNYRDTADVNAINTAINTINNYIESVSNYKEFSQSVSGKSQASDQEEMEYLDNLEAETTDTIDTLKVKVDSSINQTQADQVKQQIIQPILQNTLLIKILPIAALFMVLAVTLGFKYRL